MHCPNCGTKVSTEQKFCRSCGLELQAIQQLVTHQLSGVKPVQTRAALRARVAWLMFSGIAVMFSGAGLLSLEKRYGWGDWAGLLGLLMVIGGVLLALYAGLEPVLFPPKPFRKLPQPAEQFAAATTSKLTLTPGAEPVLSVTEHTTRTLEPVAAKSGELA